MNRVKDSIALGRVPTKATREKYSLSEKDVNDLRALAGFAPVDSVSLSRPRTSSSC